MENEIKKRRGRPRKVDITDTTDLTDVKISTELLDKLEVYYDISSSLSCSTATEMVNNVIEEYLNSEEVNKVFNENKGLVKKELDLLRTKRKAAKLEKEIKEDKSKK